MADDGTVQCPLCKGERTRIVTRKDGIKEERRCFLCAGAGKTLWRTATSFRRFQRMAGRLNLQKPKKPPEPE